MARIARIKAEGEDIAIAAELGKLRSRMGDLSEFMETFKQRVSQWYNSNYSHEGTLCGGRMMLHERNMEWVKGKK